MKAKDLMTANPKVCSPDTTLAAAAHLMWEGDCGLLPVVDDGELVGVVTDRDMYIALATRNARASQLRVGAVATKQPVTCAPEDDVETLLAVMKQARVRRLPVVGFGNVVLGIVSMNDIVLAAGANTGPSNDDVVDTLHAICGRHQAVPRVVTA